MKVKFEENVLRGACILLSFKISIEIAPPPTKMLKKSMSSRPTGTGRLRS